MTLSITPATDAAVTLQLLDAAGDMLVSTYTGAEPLELLVWGGEDLAPLPLAGSGVSWHDAAAASLTVRFDRADTAGWPEGTYRYLVLLTDGPNRLAVHEDTLRVTAAPGLAAGPKTYCTRADLTDCCEWIEQAQTEHDTAGFARQRARARQWFDTIVIRHAPCPGGASGLQERLDADGLVVSAAVRQANALYTLALILDPKLGEKGESSYQALARRFRIEAENLAAGTAVEIDTNADGRADLVVDLGSIPVLRG